MKALILIISFFRKDRDVKSDNNHLTGLFLSSTMYLSGMFIPFKVLILSSLIFSTKVFWASQVSLNFLFSIYFTFFPNSLFSSFSTICFFNSFACFLRSSFRSFYNCSSRLFNSLCLYTAA